MGLRLHLLFPTVFSPVAQGFQFQKPLSTLHQWSLEEHPIEIASYDVMNQMYNKSEGAMGFHYNPVKDKTYYGDNLDEKKAKQLQDNIQQFMPQLKICRELCQPSCRHETSINKGVNSMKYATVVDIPAIDLKKGMPVRWKENEADDWNAVLASVATIRSPTHADVYTSFGDSRNKNITFSKENVIVEAPRMPLWCTKSYAGVTYAIFYDLFGLPYKKHPYDLSNEEQKHLLVVPDLGISDFAGVYVEKKNSPPNKMLIDNVNKLKEVGKFAVDFLVRDFNMDESSGGTAHQPEWPKTRARAGDHAVMYAFHRPPMNSIGIIHMHIILCPKDGDGLHACTEAGVFKPDRKYISPAQALKVLNSTNYRDLAWAAPTWKSDPLWTGFDNSTTVRLKDTAVRLREIKSTRRWRM